MRNWINFNGIDLKDYGVYISGNGTFNAPERDVTSVTIPGRNGELTIDNGRYKNITIKYPAFIVKEFAENIGALREYLLGCIGYQRLEDTYNPDEYRMARYSGGFTAKPVDELIAGNFDLSFNCMPQRYLKSGEEYVSVSNGGAILNPTSMTAKPLIKLTTESSYGYLTIGGIQVVSTKRNATMYIDCELQEAYTGDYVNANNYLTLTHGEFPTLPAGESGIALSNCTVEIMPRWWRL